MVTRFFILLILSTFSLNAEFQSPSQFNQPEKGSESKLTPQQRQLEAQRATYRSLQTDEKQYYEETQMPTPNAGNRYLLQSHPQQHNSLQELPDR